MSQLKIMLKHSHRDFGDAMNVLTLMRMGMMRMDTEDTMYGYMVAKDWIEWITNPDAPNRPRHADTEAAETMLGIFQDAAKACEDLLELHWIYVDDMINELNPNLDTMYQGHKSDAAEDARMFHRSLRIAAKFFDEAIGTNYSKMLDEKNVPSLESAKLKNLGY